MSAQSERVLERKKFKTVTFKVVLEIGNIKMIYDIVPAEAGPDGRLTEYYKNTFSQPYPIVKSHICSKK